MPNYLLAQTQLRYSNENLARWSKAGAILRDLMAAQGIILRQAMVTQLGGRLFEVWNLWELDDAEHVGRARKGFRETDAYRAFHAIVSDIIEAETFRYLQSLPYASTFD